MSIKKLIKAEKASASELKPYILREQTIDVLGQNEMKVVFTQNHKWGWDTETKMFYLLID